MLRLLQPPRGFTEAPAEASVMKHYHSTCNQKPIRLTSHTWFSLPKTICFTQSHGRNTELVMYLLMMMMGIFIMIIFPGKNESEPFKGEMGKCINAEDNGNVPHFQSGHFHRMVVVMVASRAQWTEEEDKKQNGKKNSSKQMNHQFVSTCAANNHNRLENSDVSSLGTVCDTT